MARQTLESYRRDLEGLARWRAGAGGGLLGIDRVALFDYLRWRAQANYSPRSTARLLSTLRAFYGWCLRDGVRSDDPTALIDPPQLPRSLPKALTESQIEALLAAPEVDTPAGLRDRAMLELMYAAGLRVSELVNLPAVGVNLRQGVLRVTGKGSKDRLVPLGEESQHWLERYLREARPLLAANKPVAAVDGQVPLFIDAARQALSRQHFWALVKRYAAVAGIDPAMVSPHGCATALPPICSTTAPTCARCRCCWATARCRPPRSIRWWRASICRSCTPAIIRVVSPRGV